VESVMMPFSFNDLGLSDDEIAGLDSVNETADTAATPAESADLDDSLLTPFSLNDLGLSDDEIAGLGDLDTAGSTGSLGLGSPDPRPTPPAEPQSSFDMGDLPADLQPFSLDELDLNSDAD